MAGLYVLTTLFLYIMVGAAVGKITQGHIAHYKYDSDKEAVTICAAIFWPMTVAVLIGLAIPSYIVHKIRTRNTPKAIVYKE